MRHVGFTGTRVGMTGAQKATLTTALSKYTSLAFHHGDCVGADAEAHDIAKSLGAHIVGHPPIKDDLRARKSFDEERPPKTYFARNRDIVMESETLFAAPATFEETQGGTWYTINYGLRQHKHVVIIFPDGKISSEDK